MKKNITINMQGRLYAIDEDAYNLLKQYEDSLRGYFSRKDGGGEIVDDIEARIAELFDEVKASGKVAVDIDDVQRIITRIGNPQQMDDEAPGADNAGGAGYGGPDGHRQEGEAVWQKARNVFVRPGRRLYRDPQDKKVCGVLSGMAHYYGGDVTIWRIAVAVIGVLFLTMPGDWDKWAVYMLIVYFILGMVIPQANTPEDRLRMKGQDVNPQNLAEEVASEGKAEADGHKGRPCNARNESQQRGCLATLGDLLAGLIKIVAWLAFGIVMIVFVSILVGLLLLLFAPSLAIFSDSGVAFSWSEHPWTGTVGILSLAVLTILIAYSIVSRNNQRNMSAAGRIVFIVLLVASLVGSIACATIIISNMKKQVEDFDISWSRSETQRHTHGGIYMQDTDWNYLRSGGWKILQHDNCHNRYTGSGEYYTGNGDKRYLDCYDESGQQLYRAERTDSALAPGTYTLSAVVRSDGTGAYIYAIADGKTYKVQIPAEGNTGGQVWQDAKAETNAIPDDSTAVGKYKIIKDIADANDGNGYGWSCVAISGIRCKTGTIGYGLTSVPSITSDQFAGTWFSAADFKLKREE